MASTTWSRDTFFTGNSIFNIDKGIKDESVIITAQ
jgi:hypothetical protein